MWDIPKMVDTALGVVSKFIPDKAAESKARAELESQLLQIQSNSLQLQLEINKEEAKHASVFVAGWRPCIGWICAVAYGWTFVIRPIICDIYWMLTKTAIATVPTDMQELSLVLFGMLGLGAMRTFEKTKGVTR